MRGHRLRDLEMLARRLAGVAYEQLNAFLRDPFFFLTVSLLFVKSWLAVLLINNPDHSALDLSYRDAYQTSFAIFISFVAIPASLGFLLRGRSRLAYYLVLDGLFSLLMVADLWYFRAYSTFLSFLLWQQTGNLKGLWASVFAMARPVDLLFLADLVVLVPAALLWRGLYRRAQRGVAIAAFLGLAAVGCLWTEHRRLDVNGTVSEVRFVEPCWEARQTVNFQSPVGFHALDFFDIYLRNRSTALTSTQRDAIRSWFAANGEHLPGNRFRGLLRGRNLIVVQVESFEAFVIGQRVAGQEITPVLNGLLPSSLYFDNIHDQAHEGLSSDSDLMVNTSVYPLRRGSTFFQFPGNSYNSLPRILRSAGYRKTVAMHPDRAVYWNWKNALTSIGFDTCLDITAFTRREVDGLGLSDAEFLPQAAATLVGQPEPFYAFLVTLSSHAPFELPEEDCELELDAKLEGSTLGTALQCFRYTDRQIGVFLDRLRASGILERSAVVLYGDHASVHRFFNDEVRAMQGTEEWMRDGRCLVPFIVYAPGLVGERFTVTGGQIDIMPTLLDLLGVDEGLIAETAMGRDLLATRRDFAVLPDGTLVGRDAGDPSVSRAAEGLAVADLIIRGDYFREAGPSPR